MMGVHGVCGGTGPILSYSQQARQGLPCWTRAPGLLWLAVPRLVSVSGLTAQSQRKLLAVLCRNEGCMPC